jgi:hypothetical protein
MRYYRLLLCLVVSFATWTATAQNDQLKTQFGVKGGVQVSEMSFTSDVLKRSNRAGFFLGPVVKFKTPIVGFGVDVAALYDQRDLKVDGHVIKQKSIIVPANARLGADVFSMLGLFISAGPQFCFNLGDDIFHWTSEENIDKQFTLQNTTLSLNLGVGVTVGRHIEGALYYNMPLGKTGDFTWNDLSQQLHEESWSHAKSTVDAWRISITYFF